MRCSTLFEQYGPVKLATKISDREWLTAVDEGRFLTVYHGDSDHCSPLQGKVRHHGCVNALCKMTFGKPVPDHVDTIIGMRDYQPLWDLLNTL